MKLIYTWSSIYKSSDNANSVCNESISIKFFLIYIQTELCKCWAITTIQPQRSKIYGGKGSPNLWKSGSLQRMAFSTHGIVLTLTITSLLSYDCYYFWNLNKHQQKVNDHLRNRQLNSKLDTNHWNKWKQRQVKPYLTITWGSVEELSDVAASVRVMVCWERETDHRVMPCTNSSPADIITWGGKPNYLKHLFGAGLVWISLHLILQHSGNSRISFRTRISQGIVI